MSLFSSKKIREKISHTKMVAEDTGAAAAAATERGGGGFTKRNVVCLLILFFVNLVNYMDRYTVSSRLVVSKFKCKCL